MYDSKNYANIPMRNVGPIKIISSLEENEVMVPLATFETPLWASVNRGARVSRLAGGIKVVLVEDKMSRSVLLEGPNATYIYDVVNKLAQHRDDLNKIVLHSSKFAKLQNYYTRIVGNLLYIRFELTTGDAAGHNMTTKAADNLISWLLEAFTNLKYVSISGNLCTDKKVSAVNSILGRGKYVVAEISIPEDICRQHLKTMPADILNLNIKKNLIGSLIAGSINSANAHFANMLLALYLATGQDAANIIEGSQGIVHTEVCNNDLYFSVTLPNIIVGTVGNGKHLPFVQKNLAILGCTDLRDVGYNSKKLATIIAATVLCGEISLLAAQTNRGELVEAHMRLERDNTEQYYE